MDTIKIDMLVRSHRKSIALEIDRYARLIVRAPRFAPKKLIESVIKQKRNWIVRKQKEQKKRYEESRPRLFLEGEEFYFFGSLYPLHMRNTGEDGLFFSEKSFFLDKSQSLHARELFIQWYKTSLKTYLETRVFAIAQKYDIPVKKISVTRAEKRWGSCSPSGNLNFSWRLMLTPPVVIDYIIIHELAHVKERNHSRRFWDRVRLMMPDYKRYDLWIKNNGHKFKI